MGYKSALRTINSFANRADAEAQRRRRQEEREIGKLKKKIETFDERMERIDRSLDEKYASGKINKEKYENLKTRKLDIGEELIVLAKTPGVTLAKRYITGEIDKEEFERIKKDLLPVELFEEKEKIQETLKNILKELEKFRKECKKVSEKTCQRCGTKEAFLRPIKLEDNLQLCGNCKIKLLKIQNYDGFEGKYLTAMPIKIRFIDLANKGFNFKVSLNIDKF